MSNRVEGYGNYSAKLVIIGEAPGSNEEAEGIPFVGPTGVLLSECLDEAGMDIGNCYRTNVVKVRPPDNDLTRLPEIGYNIRDFIPELYEEIRQINPNCILLVGETALKYCTDYSGIMKYRGSILHSKLGIKCVPCIHPAALLQHGDTKLPWINLAYIKADVKRAVEESYDSRYSVPEPNLHIAKSSLDVIRFRERYNGYKKLTLDVETFKTFPVCIGLAYSKDEAISIPTFESSIPDHDKAFIWREINDILRSSDIVAQNGKFDQKRVRQLGLGFKLWFGIDLAWHILWPEMPKKLEFISSLITKVPFYKDEGREFNPAKDDISRLYLYNAKDCTTEHECMEIILKDLEENNLLDFFFDKIMPLHDLYYDIEDVGLLIDEKIRSNLTKHYQELRLERKNEMLNSIKLLGGDTFSILRKKKGIDTPTEIKVEDFNSDSPSQVAAMLYGYLRCPVRRDTKDSTLKALVNNGIKDSVRKDIVNKILEDRKFGKTINTYLLSPLSSGGPHNPLSFGRVHYQVNINGAKTGRTSDSKLEPPVCIKPEGIALKTMTKHEDVTLDAGGADLRSMFIADPGWSFIEADLSSAEDWVVAVLSCDSNAIAELSRKDFKYNKNGLKDDRHTKTAITVLSKLFEDIIDYDRQIGKKTRHSGNYYIQKHTAMINGAKYGIFLSEWKWGKMLESFHSSNPKIIGVFHADIQEALRSNNNTLYSPLGRRETFFDQWGNEMFKQAYAFIPQATVADQVKFAMVRIKRRVEKSWFKFVGESHDSCLPLVRDDKIVEAGKIIKEEMEQEIDFKNCTLSRNIKIVIPCELKLGKRWIDKSEDFPDGMEKFKL
jgi:uracil-DNA glycosylase family 4